MVRIEVLGSGSKGNCTFVQGGRTRVLVDAGFSCREIARRLHAIGERPEDLDAVLVTHEHADHVAGASILSRKHGIPIACAAQTLVAAGLDGDGAAEWLPVEPGACFDLGDLRVEAFEVPHDAVLTLGFRIRAEGLVLGYATDLGHATNVVRQRLASAHVLVLESNHDLDMLRDGPYPWSLKQRVGGRHGHLSNEAAAGLLDQIVTSESIAVALAHLSEVNNVPDLAVVNARAALDRRGLPDVRLVALSQHRPMQVLVA